MDEATRQRFDRVVSQPHIDAAAAFAASRLTKGGSARVRLSPGDMTEYRILVAPPGPEFGYRLDVGDFGQVTGGNYWVALCADFGRGYEWAGQPVDGGYATDKWTSRDTTSGQWTGEIVARFLTALSAALDNRGAHHVAAVRLTETTTPAETDS